MKNTQRLEKDEMITAIEHPEQTFKKATNGRGWSDYQIQQEKRQKEINKRVYAQRPEEISLKETLFWFVIICFCVYLLTN